MFKPDEILYENNISEYELGKFLLEKYKDIPMKIIDNHNNIPEMRSKENSSFPSMKKKIIIGIRKTHKYTPNSKVSDFLVPYTSSGCTAMCLYCYLVCNYNKCSYLRLFVNREEMLNKIIKTSEKSEKELTFEIGSNSDLILENTITNNLVWTIENFANCKKGLLTFPTKFDMVDPILNIKGKERVIIRMSVNPDKIINAVEFGTSRLDDRIVAINKLCDAGYKVGILIAPIILIHSWKEEYENLILYLKNNINSKYHNKLFFELIFMTYSYIHRMINKEAFPNAIDLYDKEKMRARGRGKYAYNNQSREEGTEFLLKILKREFPETRIWYVS